MKYLKQLWHILLHGAFYNTLMIVLFSTIAYAYGNLLPTISTMYLILAFSMIVAAANQLFLLKKLPIALKLLFHFLILIISFYILYIIIGGFAGNASVSMIVLVAFTAIYFVIAAIVLLIRAIFLAGKNKKEAYDSQFPSKSL